MDPHIPATQTYITIAGNRFRLIPVDKLLSPELRELKRVSGVSPVPFIAAIRDADWDAWFAWIYVSLRRERPNLTVAQLEHEVGDTPPGELIGSVEEETPEAAETDPLEPGTSENESESTPNESDSGEKTPPSSTSEPSGPPTSGTQT